MSNRLFSRKHALRSEPAEHKKHKTCAETKTSLLHMTYCKTNKLNRKRKKDNNQTGKNTMPV